MTSSQPIRIDAAEANWPNLLQLVERDHSSIVITQQGLPIAQLAPYDDQEALHPAFGCMAGTGTIIGDIMAPLDVKWDANED